MLRALNCTLLNLISKKEGADNLDSFHPISLRNVVYKIITKLIADRLKICLPVVILEEQGGFVAGKQNLDEIVIASEVIQSMHTSKERAMFIKLDMAKAYDRVKWSFFPKDPLGPWFLPTVGELDYELCYLNFFFYYGEWCFFRALWCL